MEDIPAWGIIIPTIHKPGDTYVYIQGGKEWPHKHA